MLHCFLRIGTEQRDDDNMDIFQRGDEVCMVRVVYRADFDVGRIRSFGSGAGEDNGGVVAYGKDALLLLLMLDETSSCWKSIGMSEDKDWNRIT